MSVVCVAVLIITYFSLILQQQLIPLYACESNESNRQESELRQVVEHLKSSFKLIKIELEKVKSHAYLASEFGQISEVPEGIGRVKRRAVPSLPPLDAADLNERRGYVALDGAPGLDGVPGADGRPGRDGKDGLDGKDGRNGKDGQPGERGLPGPAGAPGEPGKRGRPGPAGKQGLPGTPGVCAYRAAYNCSATKVDGGASKQAEQLLMAPTMVSSSGQSISGGALDDERQVSVNEGDNIQLSCDAFGLPPPIYVWRLRGATQQDVAPASASVSGNNNNNGAPTILLDAQLDLRASSFSGARLPLANVDRRQAGDYECVASNGVPPSALKRISLDVNYAPTVRLRPATSRHSLELASSLVLECLVEANPSAVAYWTLGGQIIMSTLGSGSSATSNGALEQQEQEPSITDGAESAKLVLTESTGQLATGATYSILTLNIRRLEANHLGEYKCVAKNLIGQSVGQIELALPDGQQRHESAFSAAHSERAQFHLEALDRSLGWPNYLLDERSSGGDQLSGSEPARYATFGNEHRRKQPDRKPETIAQAFGRISRPVQVDWGGSVEQQNWMLGVELQQIESSTTIASSRNTETTTAKEPRINWNNFTKVAQPEWQAAELLPSETDDEATTTTKLCERLINNIDQQNLQQQNQSLNRNRSTRRLLDKLGKPVYVGNGAQWDSALAAAATSETPISWWSLDTFSPSTSTRHFVSSSSQPDKLFQYESLASLQSHFQGQGGQKVDTSENKTTSDENAVLVHQLKRRIAINGAQLVYKNHFIYLVERTIKSVQSIESLSVCLVNLESGQQTLMELRGGDIVPTSTGAQFVEFKLDRLDLVSDESGVWLIVPTLESQTNGALSKFRRETDVDLLWSIGNRSLERASRSTKTLARRQAEQRPRLVRRLHLLKLNLTNLEGQNNTADDDYDDGAKKIADNESRRLEFDHHFSLKLDWRMIGQWFVIDAVLYGIKDRHSYSSKLQFAYDLYRCKLLPADYSAEPHRVFTNHFGNTQMIKYNPNEPKRLYIIDKGNLLWRPVKLMELTADESG